MSRQSERWREWDRRRCVRKRAYPTRDAAHAALTRLPDDRDAARRNVYPCRDHWHVGRKPVVVDRSVYR